jgi:hypothetical protein
VCPGSLYTLDFYTFSLGYLLFVLYSGLSGFFVLRLHPRLSTTWTFGRVMVISFDFTTIITLRLISPMD